MKKVLLAGTALVATALIASPAQAELKLDLGGHFSGYAVYVDQDNDTGFDSFAFRRNTEIHFTGETTLDNGLTVGVHVEQEIENTNVNNESYVYFSGQWGRVNFGNEDGAAYLLQVASPSADSNVDGLRSTINAIRVPGNAALAGATVPLLGNDLPGAGATFALDYQHADFGNAPLDSGKNASVDRLTYLTPKFNGFQAGASYAPRAEQATGIMSTPQGAFEDLWEIAARWDGEFEGVGISFGAGYSHADGNTIVIPPATNIPDIKTWNVGANLAWNQFSFGANYLDSDFGTDSRTWNVGAGWDNGPYHLGITYLNDKVDDAGLTYQNAAADPLQTNDAKAWRVAVGGGYTFGPGMSFRGSIAFGELDFGSVSDGVTSVGAKEDFTQVTIGTDIRF